MWIYGQSVQISVDDNIEIRYRSELTVTRFHEGLTDIKYYYYWATKLAVL